MTQVSDVAAYLCDRYPHKGELSKTRLTKLVYLADWESARRTGRQMTDIQWIFHNFGPYVDDVVDAAKADGRFNIVQTVNHYGDPKLEIRVRDNADTERGLTEADKGILDSVIEKTKSMYWNAFIKHVYSTPPIAHSDRYEFLDLVSHAKSGPSAG